MTIPAPPLPSLGDLVHGLNAQAFTGETFAGARPRRVCRVYRSGRLALAAGVDAVRRARGTETAALLVPGYFCNEALEPLRRLGITLAFYPLGDDLGPDWEAVRAALDASERPTMFLLVHYFGFPGVTAQAAAFCRRHGLTLVEDAAHVLVPTVGIGVGDLVIFSPRKLLAVPAGGVLVASEEMGALLDLPTDGAAWQETVAWTARRLTQRLLVGLRVPWHRLWPPAEAEPRSGSTEPVRMLGCGPFGLRLLTVTERSWPEVAARRRQNYQRLLDRVAGLPGVRPLYPSLGADVCPYAFPLLVDGSSAGLVGRLRARGIPASRWPDLPPEVLARPDVHRAALRTYERLALLPVHQSLGSAQLERIGDELGAALTGRAAA
jgi:perosamine synthetase